MSSEPLQLGWIGTGVMGIPMCGRLLANGYPVWVHTRTPAKAKTLLDQGARWAASPRAVAEHATVIFTMAGFPDDVRAVYWAQDGVLAGLQAGSTIVDFSTTEPRLARELYETARHRDMVGGDRAALDPVRPLLERWAVASSIKVQLVTVNMPSCAIKS